MCEIKKIAFEDYLKKKIKLAETGDEKSQEFLATSYFVGIEKLEGELKDEIIVKYNTSYLSVDYQNAMYWLKKLAEGKNTNAMLKIAHIYKYGKGQERNLEVASEWYTKAAKLGSAEAYCALGTMYEFGYGVEQCWDKKVECFIKAAELGSGQAMIDLAELYKENYGVCRDYEEALKWYQKAVDIEYAKAFYLLGIMYEEGQGVTLSYERAIKLYEKGAALGDLFAMNRLGMLYEEAVGVEQDYEEAKRWYEKAAKLNSVYSMQRLIKLYNDLDGVEQDYEKTIELCMKTAQTGEVGTPLKHCYGTNFNCCIEKAKITAKQNDLMGINILGYVHLYGLGVEQNCEKAINWYRKSFELGCGVAANMLGIISKKIEMNVLGKRPIYWYKYAAKSGVVAAYANIGLAYLEDYYVIKNYEEAKRWYEKGVKYCNPSAMYQLGNLCIIIGDKEGEMSGMIWYKHSARLNNIEGAHKAGKVSEFWFSMKESEKWYEKAANLGNVESMIEIGDMHYLEASDKLSKESEELESKEEKEIISNEKDQTRNHENMFKWYEKASELGSVYSMYQLGKSYEDLNEDYIEAIKWYEKAADLGCADAINRLAEIYIKGKGVNVNYNKAIDWYEKGLNLNDYYSMYYLGVMYLEGKGLEVNLKKAQMLLEKAIEYEEKNSWYPHIRKNATELLKEIEAKI